MPQGCTEFFIIEPEGRARHGLEDNIKMDHEDIG
jgi:hypothetical protein